MDWTIYLFQVPPQMTNSERLLRFFDGLLLLEKCVLEIRNRTLLLDRYGLQKTTGMPSPRICRFAGYQEQDLFRPCHLHEDARRDDWVRGTDYLQEELVKTAAMI